MSLVDTDTGEVVAMNREQAEKVTADIKAWAGTLWVKLRDAHRGRAWVAMGYATWADYVATEFDMSRSYAYRLVSHADAVVELAEAAGVSPMGDTAMSPIGDIPEGRLRAIDTEAAAADVAAAVDALPEDATDEDRVEVVERVTRTHYERTKPQTPAGSPTPNPGVDEGDDEPIRSAAPSDADQAGEDSASPAGPPKSIDDLYPAETYRINAGKARVKTYGALAALDPTAAAEHEDVAGRESWVDLAKTLRSMADDIDAAFGATPTLRRVQ